MSLATIKNKESKGKQKQLPKLKTILANPNKVKSPTLNDDELEILNKILQSAIDKSKMEPKSYATNMGIKLGLESSLRCINGQKSSCVFISLSIKPSHIVSLIARNAEIKDETQPVYAQPLLEIFLEKIFGIKAICMVLPKNLQDISEDLFKWVEERKKPKRVKVAEKQLTKTHKKKQPTILKTNIKNLPTTEVKPKELKKSEDCLSKPWSGDFISFSNNAPNMERVKLSKDNALDALTQIIDKVPAKLMIENDQPMEIDIVKETYSVQLDNDKDLEDSDDFLGDYKSLTVHKIKGNPNKKPKKKRKKNNNKNKSNAK